MTYAFTLDAKACSGCKACQEACKDKNGLPAGILWRRVIEVSGGEWRARGSAWENSVFAYYLSLSCNHCTHPKCAGVCPTDAFTVRPDGIVLIDASKCMGCGYCAWACPYGAPQFDRAQGTMAKCNFCYDNLDAGMLPSCVTACPLRVLNITTIEELNPVESHQYLWQLPGSEHPFPLPDFSRTQPHLAIKPHPGMSNTLKKTVSNREEIIPPGAFEYPKRIAARHEWPLVAFTLLAQTAAGIALFKALFSPFSTQLTLSIGILLALGGLISFLHLGQKRNAWRSVIHLKKSWLSREVLLAGLFGLAWAATTSLEWLRGIRMSAWFLAILGIGLIYCMSRVYLLRAVPGWNTWRTSVSFFLSATVLGALGVRLAVAHPALAILAAVAMFAEMLLVSTSLPGPGNAPSRLHAILISLGILGLLFTTLFPQGSSKWMPFLVILLVLAAEAISRWQFYARRVPFPASSN